MKEIEKRDLLRIIPFPIPTYEHVSLTTLTAYSAYWLSEWNITPSIEDVAVASHRMFPAKFAMVGWPEFPDLNRTNRSLLQMRPMYRNLATSISNKGVFLNANGINEARALTDRLGPPQFEAGVSPPMKETHIAAQRGGSKPRSVHPEDTLRAIRASKLYSLYIQGELDNAEAIHLIGLLGVYDHTPSREKRKKLRALLDAAVELQDQAVIDFLKGITKRFHGYLNK